MKYQDKSRKPHAGDAGRSQHQSPKIAAMRELVNEAIRGGDSDRSLAEVRQLARLRHAELDDFNRFCDDVSEQARAKGLTHDKLDELLGSDD